MTDPKPVVWGQSFNKKEGESDHDALVRCYPELLEFRARRYANLADITLPYDIARAPQSSGEDFLNAIYALLFAEDSERSKSETLLLPSDAGNKM